MTRCYQREHAATLSHRVIRPSVDQQSRANESEGRAISDSRSLIADRVNRRVEAFQCQPCKERNMRKLILATLVVLLAGLSASYARGGMHSFGGARGLMAPANSTVPPSLTPDTRLTGTAPVPPHHQPTAADVSSLPSLKLDPEDAAVDRAIGNICRGC